MNTLELREVTAVDRQMRHVTRLVADAVGGSPEVALDRAHRLEGQGRCFLLWWRGQAVAAVIGHEEARRFTIDAIGVAPSRRRTGLGRHLLVMLRERLAGPAVAAETDDDTVGFYERCGFTVSPAPDRHGRRRYACTLGGVGTPTGLPRASVA